MDFSKIWKPNGSKLTPTLEYWKGWWPWQKELNYHIIAWHHREYSIRLGPREEWPKKGTERKIGREFQHTLCDNEPEIGWGQQV